MTFKELPLKGSYIIEKHSFQDNRGYFSRIFCKDTFQKMGMNKDILQINHSITKQAGAIRGMHFQHPPYSEIKIIQCLKGRVFDVIIDIRKNSKTFLQWVGIELSPQKQNIIYVPEGFAHGFQVLEENSELLYFHTANYTPSAEDAIMFDEPKIGIKWPLNVTDISQRDKSHQYLSPNFIGLDI